MKSLISPQLRATLWTLVVLLNGWNGNISEFVNVIDDGTNTSIQIDADGLNNGSNFSTVAQLNNVTGLDESAIYNSGQLVVI